MAKQGFVEIAVVTTVSGNVNCQCTFANASRTLSLGGFENVEVGRSSPVHSATHIPSPATYVKHFGSMDAAFQQLFNEVRTPEEILTDNGTQYVTWRGKSAFTKELEKRGIRQVVASPRRPQTLGKIERFWGTLWRECIETAIFLDMADSQRRIGHFIDYYNFQRTHQGIDGLVPADRYFGAGSEVLATLKKRVAANALELARHGVPKKPFYLTGQVGGKSFSVHAEGERVILKRQGEARQEVDLVSPEDQLPADSPCPAEEDEIAVDGR